VLALVQAGDVGEGDRGPTKKRQRSEGAQKPFERHLLVSSS